MLWCRNDLEVIVFIWVWRVNFSLSRPWQFWHCGLHFKNTLSHAQIKRFKGQNWFSWKEESSPMIGICHWVAKLTYLLQEQNSPRLNPHWSPFYGSSSDLFLYEVSPKPSQWGNFSLPLTASWNPFQDFWNPSKARLTRSWSNTTSHTTPTSSRTWMNLDKYVTMGSSCLSGYSSVSP